MLSGSARTKLACVLGDPVSHSLSPLMHNAAFRKCEIDALYLALSISPPGLRAAIATLRESRALGANLTVPHKEQACDLVDELDESAATVRAVNTLVFEKGKVKGYNTDGAGYCRALIDEQGLDLVGRRALLLGAGGAARGLHAALTNATKSEVQVVARRPDAVTFTSAHSFTDDSLAALLPTVDLVIDCTPTGLSQATEGKLPAAIPWDKAPPHLHASTLIYHRETKFERDANAAGLSTSNGEGMLLYQGALAFERWTGVDAPIEVMRSALRQGRASL